MEVCESHKGAETIPGRAVSTRVAVSWSGNIKLARTILKEDIEALLDEQIGVENDQAKGERENVVTGPFLEEVPDGSLQQ